ncbi:hypothetical protein EG329_006764 [Mollisiaceae sp. DMI_Dod_QoI]|nr:hypothetical protein EG329_006764 [Helotiales sp. DMI_Dod_QoI]
MASNKSIRDFFKPAQPVTKLQSSSMSRTSPPPQVSNATTPGIRASNLPKSTYSQSQVARAPSPASKTSDQRDQSSSLSSPPSTISSEPPFSPQRENVPFRSLSNNDSNSERVIENSDDEDEDSDSSLEDLGALLAARSSERAKQAANGRTPSTPVASRQQKTTYDFHSSPLAVLPKYKFDMKSLISHVEADEATEASSKRVKAMLAGRNENEDDLPMFHDEEAADSAAFAHGALLDSVVAEREDGGAHKVKRALMRTEATVTDKSWYFFDTSSSPANKQEPFPVASVPKSWQAEFVDPKIRYQTFISGFAEDMVAFGKKLPDELFLWMLDEICFEPSDPLRNAYTFVLKASSEQVSRLVDPKLVQRLFDNLGAASHATNIFDRAKPVQRLSTPYAHRDWANLLSTVRLLGRLSKSLMLAAKSCSICMLLRMSMDKLVSENIEILDTVQETINRLCLSITDEDEWTKCCTEMCKPLFSSVEEPTLRLQMVEVISSIHPRTHDLRRRLAMCFYFNDIAYSKHHSHSLMDIDTFIGRLEAPEFDTSPQTDYRELTALIMLLDIALDDGRSTKLDLSDPAVENKFNEDVDALGNAIKQIMTSIGNPGAAFISRIEAKEILELVSQRIVDTVRTKRKPRHTWFDHDRGKKEEDLQSEKKGMANFVTKMKSIGSNGVNSQVAD